MAIQIYTGDGKGKTTAATGLCARALGAGMKVLFAQFLKDGTSSEFKTLSLQPDFIFKAYGSGSFVFGKPAESEVERARAGLAEISSLLLSGEFGLAVLDEACCAVNAGLFSSQELLAAVKQAPASTEIVLTGRGATPELIAAADLVSELKCVKHYYNSGAQARLGIEF